MIGERLQFVADTLTAIGFEHVSIRYGYVYVTYDSNVTIRLYVDRSNVVQFESYAVNMTSNPIDVANFVLRVVNTTAYLFVS